MIYIRVERWPLGDRRRRRLLGEATISGIGTGAYATRLSRLADRIGRRGGFAASPEVAAGCPPDSDTLHAAEMRPAPAAPASIWDLILAALQSATAVRHGEWSTPCPT